MFVDLLLKREWIVEKIFDKKLKNTSKNDVFKQPDELLFENNKLFYLKNRSNCIKVE